VQKDVVIFIVPKMKNYSITVIHYFPVALNGSNVRISLKLSKIASDFDLCLGEDKSKVFASKAGTCLHLIVLNFELFFLESILLLNFL